jgi:hypothetical protein
VTLVCWKGRTLNFFDGFEDFLDTVITVQTNFNFHYLMKKISYQKDYQNSNYKSCKVQSWLLHWPFWLMRMFLCIWCFKPSTEKRKANSNRKDKVKEDRIGFLTWIKEAFTFLGIGVCHVWPPLTTLSGSLHQGFALKYCLKKKNVLPSNKCNKNNEFFHYVAFNGFSG